MSISDSELERDRDIRKVFGDKQRQHINPKNLRKGSAEPSDIIKRSEGEGVGRDDKCD